MPNGQSEPNYSNSVVRLSVGPLPPGTRVWVDEYIELMEKKCDPDEAIIDEQWRQLQADLARSRQPRRRGRPRKNPLA